MRAKLLRRRAFFEKLSPKTLSIQRQALLPTRPFEVTAVCTSAGTFRTKSQLSGTIA